MNVNTDRIQELKDKAYEIATKKYCETAYNYGVDARTQSMIAYALLQSQRS